MFLTPGAEKLNLSSIAIIKARWGRTVSTSPKFPEGIWPLVNSPLLRLTLLVEQRSLQQPSTVWDYSIKMPGKGLSAKHKEGTISLTDKTLAVFCIWTVGL